MPKPPNASRADIIAMLREGHSNSRIMRDLRCDKQRVRRLREELGLPTFVPTEQTRTIEEKWALFTQPIDGDHLEWTGTRGTASGTPVLSYKEKLYTAASIAFTIRTGREPDGYVLPDCGMPHCVAPGHVDDEPGRLAKRAQVRQAAGRGERPATCAQCGRDQNEFGRFEADGTPYCHGCKLDYKRDPGAAKAARATARDARFRDMDALLRAGVPQIRIAQQFRVAWATVSRRREELGLPAPKAGRLVGHGSLKDVFQANTERVDGGHLRWTGYVSTTGSAYVCHRQERVTPATLAFRMHFGRPPVGRARPECGMDGCVEGAHLADGPMRAANRRADKAFAAIFGEAA
ncbi:MAG TPA: hypothetical protein VL251_08455 [Thermomonas sp.]|jgi:hypothetical protein|nr:hypothetical protein [Thermomonas sp.]